MSSNPVRLMAASLIAASIVASTAAPAGAACPAYSHVDEALAAVGAPSANGAPFFTHSMTGAYGYTPADITALWGVPSPSSSTYYAEITSGVHFTKIASARLIERGDVLVIDATGGYTGHTAIITDPPVMVSPQVNPRYSGTTQWAVPIVDATSAPHGCVNASYPDSRCTSGAATGTGTMRVYTDSLTGVLLGYTWSLTDSYTSYFAPNVRPYAVGRLTPCPP